MPLSTKPTKPTKPTDRSSATACHRHRHRRSWSPTDSSSSTPPSHPCTHGSRERRGTDAGAAPVGFDSGSRPVNGPFRSQHDEEMRSQIQRKTSCTESTRRIFGAVNIRPLQQCPGGGRVPPLRTKALRATFAPSATSAGPWRTFLRGLDSPGLAADQNGSAPRHPRLHRTGRLVRSDGTWDGRHRVSPGELGGKGEGSEGRI